MASRVPGLAAGARSRASESAGPAGGCKGGGRLARPRGVLRFRLEVRWADWEDVFRAARVFGSEALPRFGVAVGVWDAGVGGARAEFRRDRRAPHSTCALPASDNNAASSEADIVSYVLTGALRAAARGVRRNVDLALACGGACSARHLLRA